MLMDLARTRSRDQVPNPDLREFLEENLASLYPDDYFRLLKIERMASCSLGSAASDFLLESWLETQRRLDELLAICPSQRTLGSALAARDNKDFRSDLFIWSLIDREKSELVQ